MHTEIFFNKIKSYTQLNAEAESDWTTLLKAKTYNKGEDFIRLGQIPKKVAFVVKGLFSQNYIAESGDTVIKYFFPEGRIAGSIPATLIKAESQFSITAIENSDVLEYDFYEFKSLVTKHRDIASFYISYMEQHWIIEKEPYEISLRYDEAKTRYDELLTKYPNLITRLKKHQVAAFLGITPTQLSRIFFANK